MLVMNKGALFAKEDKRTAEAEGMYAATEEIVPLSETKDETEWLLIWDIDDLDAWGTTLLIPKLRSKGKRRLW